MRTTLLVDDGQIIAIGGMTADTVSINRNGIPLLMDIPYLGWLFSWQSRTHNRMNLVVFLRPVIIKNAKGYAALTNNRYSYIVGQQEEVKAKGNAMLPRIDPVTLENQLPYTRRLMQDGQDVAVINNNLTSEDLKAKDSTIQPWVEPVTLEKSQLPYTNNQMQNSQNKKPRKAKKSVRANANNATLSQTNHSVNLESRAPYTKGVMQNSQRGKTTTPAPEVVDLRSSTLKRKKKNTTSSNISYTSQP
jgi:hypothetical protein